MSWDRREGEWIIWEVLVKPGRKRVFKPRGFDGGFQVRDPSTGKVERNLPKRGLRKRE